MCGGTAQDTAIADTLAGLSPRVRGNHTGHINDECLSGSIPACAGEPILIMCSEALHKVYPRVCGGTPNPRTTRKGDWGLSPRVRGNPEPKDDKERGLGSIPACAGEPRTQGRQGKGTGVYPRVCGGTLLRYECLPIQMGLSPRVRGNLKYRTGIAGHSRSIPACAGEPVEQRCRQADSQVYPRVCGGTNDGFYRGRYGLGLSPRVRGNHIFLGGSVHGSGSIPACAGEPTADRGYNGIYRVYPRVCGGTTSMFLGWSAISGLSPRVRGNQPKKQPLPST